jgi:hypothetical protein
MWRLPYLALINISAVTKETPYTQGASSPSQTTFEAPYAQGDSSPSQTIFEAPYVQGASSTSQTKLEQLKSYQIFMLEKDLKWVSSGNLGPALGSRPPGPHSQNDPIQGPYLALRLSS